MAIYNVTFNLSCEIEADNEQSAVEQARAYWDAKCPRGDDMNIDFERIE